MSWTNTKSNKDHYIKFKQAIGCFSWCKFFYVMSNLEDWENIIHFGNYFGSIGKKTYFLALGTTPVKGVGFIAGKITVTCIYYITFLITYCIHVISPYFGGSSLYFAIF